MEGLSLMKRLTLMLKYIWFPIVSITLWEIASKDAANPFFPAPSKIFIATKDVFTKEWVTQSLLTSLYTIFAGYMIGSILGLIFGSLIGSNNPAREVFTPITNFIRSIPSAAKVPVIIALFGIGLSSRITTVAIAVFFPVLLTTMRAIAGTDQYLLDYSKLLRFSYLRSLIQVRIPAATGELLAGLQAAIQISVLVMVVSEMLGSGRGLGAFVIRAQATYMITDMWVGILTIGIVGFILTEGFGLHERKVFPWYFDSKGIK
jgi:ABC-type nitrate/sulfonate/bicarbonate transport system permease component